MAPVDPSPKSPRPTGPSSRPPNSSTRWRTSGSSSASPNRLIFRLIGIPALAFAAFLIYRSAHDFFYLPECDSQRAIRTLTDVLTQLKMTPLHFEPIKTVSTSKERVECNALLPLSDGGSVNVDYSFFWQGSSADMRYSISRRPAPGAPASPPTANPTPAAPAPQAPLRQD